MIELPHYTNCPICNSKIVKTFDSPNSAYSVFNETYFKCPNTTSSPLDPQNYFEFIYCSYYDDINNISCVISQGIVIPPFKISNYSEYDIRVQSAPNWQSYIVNMESNKYIYLKFPIYIPPVIDKENFINKINTYILFL